MGSKGVMVWEVSTTKIQMPLQLLPREIETYDDYQCKEYLIRFGQHPTFRIRRELGPIDEFD
jgi:hypothetical protein